MQQNLLTNLQDLTMTHDRRLLLISNFLYKKKHGIAHAKVQVIELCTLNIDGTKILFECAKFLTL